MNDADNSKDNSLHDTAQNNQTIIIVVVVVIVSIVLFTGIVIYVYKYGKRKKIANKRNHTNIYRDSSLEVKNKKSIVNDSVTNKLYNKINTNINISKIKNKQISSIILDNPENASKLTELITPKIINVRKFDLLNCNKDKKEEKYEEQIIFKDNFSKNDDDFIEKKLSNIKSDDCFNEIKNEKIFDEIEIIEDYLSEEEIKQNYELKNKNLTDEKNNKIDLDKDSINNSNIATNNVSKNCKDGKENNFEIAL